MRFMSFSRIYLLTFMFTSDLSLFVRMHAVMYINNTTDMNGHQFMSVLFYVSIYNSVNKHVSK